MDQLIQFDGNLLIGIQNALNADWLTPIMKSITFLGEYGLLPILACLLLLIFKRTRRLGIICSLSLLVTFIVCNLGLKPIVDRERPWVLFEAVNRMVPDPGDASFPSGHTANSIAPAWAAFVATLPMKTSTGRSYDVVPCLGWRGDGADPKTAHKWSVLAIIVAALIGLSRLYLGMHFPSDVVCGFLVGMICATLVYTIIIAIEKKRGIIGGPQHKDPAATE